jgi:hypothetical protein
MPQTYTPDTRLAACGTLLCTACGSREDAHHSDGRCYTTDELVARLRFYAATNRWPGPDEGCEEMPCPR